MAIDHHLQCVDCGRPKNYNGHSRCYPCRKAKRRAEMAAGVQFDPNCNYCGKPLTEAEIATIKRRCGACRHRNNGTERTHEKRIMAFKPISAKLCQICGFNKPVAVAPDGTGVRCCDPCYKDCKTLLALEAKRKQAVHA